MRVGRKARPMAGAPAPGSPARASFPYWCCNLPYICRPPYLQGLQGTKASRPPKPPRLPGLPGLQSSQASQASRLPRPPGLQGLHAFRPPRPPGLQGLQASRPPRPPGLKEDMRKDRMCQRNIIYIDQMSTFSHIMWLRYKQ